MPLHLFIYSIFHAAFSSKIKTDFCFNEIEPITKLILRITSLIKSKSEFFFDDDDYDYEVEDQDVDAEDVLED